jgi:hypothetical protein
MRENQPIRKGNSEVGSALLIAIFALLLISVVGLALLVSTGTDTALAGNYRSSTGAYYAAVAGVEEARGRIFLKSPDYINKAHAYDTLFNPQGMPTFGLTDVMYIINPGPSETVDPKDLSNPYGDAEYFNEMGWPITGANVYTYVSSISPIPPVPGAPYKWVRINAVTEKAMAVDIDNSGGGPGSYNTFTPLYYDGSGLNLMNRGNEVLSVTALAVMPDNSKKIVQYIAAPTMISSNLLNSPPGAPPNVDFPAALTLAGSNVNFVGPGTSTFVVGGQDQTPACSSPNYMVASIGYTNSTGGDTSYANIVAGALPAGNYQGYPPTASPPPNASISPSSVLDVSASLQPNWLTPAGLDAIVQNISQNADVVINASATGSDISSRAPTMSAANLQTIVINGNLDLNGWHQTGYGLLVVAGTLYYDPDASWNGVVLVIGQGSFVSTKSGPGGINGAVFIAKTRDSSNILLSTLGAASFSQIASGAAVGINYNSCWIRGSGGAPGAQGPLNYKILAFREITP